MYNPTNGSVGLDVDARSIRLAAVRVDELLEERTPPYDKQAVERLLRRWPRVRCCYEAGPADFGSTGTCSSVVSTVQWWPGAGPQRPGDRVKTDPRDALEPIRVPSRS